MKGKLIAAAVVAALVWLVFFRRPPPAVVGTGTPPGQPPPVAPATEKHYLRNIQTGQLMDMSDPNAPGLVDTNIWKPYTPPPGAVLVNTDPSKLFTNLGA